MRPLSVIDIYCTRRIKSKQNSKESCFEDGKGIRNFHRSIKMKTNKAFTLIELLVVIAIIAILLQEVLSTKNYFYYNINCGML